MLATAAVMTWIICLPFLAAVVVALLPRESRFLSRAVALGATFLTCALSVLLFARFNGAPAVDGYKFQQTVSWVASLGISYHVGVDGINIGLILLAGVVAFAAACVSWEIRRKIIS